MMCFSSSCFCKLLTLLRHAGQQKRFLDQVLLIRKSNALNLRDLLRRGGTFHRLANDDRRDIFGIESSFRLCSQRFLAGKLYERGQRSPLEPVFGALSGLREHAADPDMLGTSSSG